VRVRRFLRANIRKIFFNPKDFRYHFIHIPKNGGQSVRYALELCKDVSLSTPYHYRYVDVVEKYGEHLSYFCIVRNPWSRTASRYWFGKQNAAKWPETDPRRQYISTATFEDYVKDQKILPIPEHPGKPWMGPLSSWYNQLEWIRDTEGRVACDCLRLEHLDADISTYLGREITIRRRNVTRNRYDYREMYNEQLIQIVADTFKEDIDYFGFDFRGPATRNIITPGST
jgi:hypothetical protein